MSAPLHHLDFTMRDFAVIATLQGEVDSSNAGIVQQELVDHATQPVLVLDLSAVEYFDSAAMAMLELVNRTTGLRLAMPRSTIVARAIELTGLDKVIPRFDTVADALAAKY
jgi:anti-anti-sigma factor